jgi:DNA repair photolyase
VKSRDTSNPTSRFAAHAVVYEDGEGPPPSTVTLLEDRSRSILSHNDSPDLPFRWSANPYRGCLHACSYCLHPDTPILLADARVRRIADLEPDDEIYGTELDGRYRRYVRTHVLDRWTTRKPAFRITLSDGTTLTASGDHRFLCERGWKYVASASRPLQRPHLTTNDSLVGTGRFAAGPTFGDDYRRGYLCGMIRGDGTLRGYDYSGRRRPGIDDQYQFRLALIDDDALDRARTYLEGFRVATTGFKLTDPRPGYQAIHAFRASSRNAFDRITALIEWPCRRSDEWDRGFLAGIFDAEGTRSCGIRISNADDSMIAHTESAMRRAGFDCVVEDVAHRYPQRNVRLRGGLREHLRFFHLTAPANTRKWDIEGRAIKLGAALRVVAIEPVGEMDLIDISTGTGDFIANGVVSHNCYARPTHEYLELGAGTDFDTKIVVKRESPELLREAFDKPSWKGESVMFSGVTDCYQAIERDLKLTRQCLEVCLEYRNPVSVISKSALVERDVDLFQALAKEARFGLAVSLAFTDHEMSRALEPWAASPDRRFKVIETMAKAGVPVGVMCAPIMPGINDRDLVGVLERAAGAGARWAGWVLLRLPGAVKQVFEERVRVALPLAADKVLHRIRDTRGGKLYRSEFHTRGRGEGPYAEAIANVFEATCARLGLNHREASYDEPATTFKRPDRSRQLSLF